MRKGLGMIALAVLLVALVAGSLVACGGTTGDDSQTTATTAAPAGTSDTAAAATTGGADTTAAAPATGEPIKIGFDEGFSGFMATDALIAEKGILTALELAGKQVAGRPIEYIKADNNSDPVVAVDKARQLVESDKIDVMLGPIFAPSAQAVTDYLAKSGGTPCISINGQPSDNLRTANKLAFIPSGFFSFAGYYLGKYCAEQLGYKTANCLNYEDTTGRQLQAGFNKGFTEAGGQILSEQYAPIDTLDFSSYLTTLKKADCTYWWIFGNGAAPFVKQYNDYGLTAPLISPMAQNLTEQQMKDLGELGVGLVGCDFYSPELDNALNKAFVAKYKEMWDGEYPAMQAFQGWLALNLFLEGVKKTNGDTTPAKLIEAMSTVSYDTPTGQYTITPYKDAYIGKGNFYILESKDVGDGRIAWVPKYTFEQMLFEEK